MPPSRKNGIFDDAKVTSESDKEILKAIFTLLPNHVSLE